MLWRKNVSSVAYLQLLKAIRAVTTLADAIEAIVARDPVFTWERTALRQTIAALSFP